MKDNKKSKERKLDIAVLKKNILPLLGVALVIFILTVAIYFVGDYVSKSYQQEEKFSGWSYQYTESPGSVPGGKLRIYNAQNPIVTERAARKNNLYLTKTLKPEETGRIMVLITDFSPVRIRLNGRDIYDNQFENEEYIGNCYNALFLEKSTHEQQLEVFMKLPFSVRVHTFLKEGTDPLYNFTTGFYFGCAMVIIGILAMIVFLVMSLIKRRMHRSIFIALLFAYTGFAVVMHLLPESTYMFNLPVWMRVCEISSLLTYMITIFFLNLLFKNNKKSGIAVGIAAALSVLAVLLVPTAALVMLSSAVTILMYLTAVIFVAQHVMFVLNQRTQYAAPVFVMCVFYLHMILFAGILLLSRLRSLYIYTVVISTLIVASVLEYIYINEYRFILKNSDIREQSMKYGNSVELISVFIRNVLSCKDKSSFYETAVNEIYDLLVKFNIENTDVRYCAAVKENGRYTQMLDNDVDDCNYQMIEDNARLNNKNCLFSDTYFEYVLTNKDDVGCIIHFENIKNGLDTFFISMIEATYCGLETTYENMFVQSDEHSINIIFEELAENIEIDTGCPVSHLENIYKYTRELCLKMGLDENRAEHIAVASKLHDLGKIAVPKYIIEKQGRLNEEERIIINSHTEFGYTILSAYADDKLIATAALIARYHHENYNGTGNNGLKGEEIPLEARIVTVCDVYDALVTERSYKSAWGKEEAINFLIENNGKKFDPEICPVFVEYLRGE